MKFAENNRISQRQLYRQIVIAFIAPFLLCLFRGRRNQGLSGLTGTLLAVAVFLFYVILENKKDGYCLFGGYIDGVYEDVEVDEKITDDSEKIK